jgi:hypothetical protein
VRPRRQWPTLLCGPSASPLDRRMVRVGANILLCFCFGLLAVGASAGDFQAVSSADVHWQPEHAHLTLGAALLAAEAEAVKHHVNFADYSTPVFRYYHDDHLGYVWSFIFDGKVPKPGNHFSVFVNDRTEHADFMPGE